MTSTNRKFSENNYHPHTLEDILFGSLLKVSGGATFFLKANCCTKNYTCFDITILSLLFILYIPMKIIIQILIKQIENCMHTNNN